VKLILSFLSLSLLSFVCFAQPVIAIENLCGTPDQSPAQSSGGGGLNTCFDPAEIMEDCATQKIWLRINVHFFLNDDCSGSLDPLNAENITPEQAYQKAESYIAAANTALDNNREQWNQVFWDVPFDDTDYCVPFRRREFRPRQHES